MIPSHPFSGSKIRCQRHMSHECGHFSRYTMCHGWMFGAWNVASLEFCRRAYVNGQYAWPASRGIEVSNLWKVSRILVLIGILLCFLCLYLQYPLMWIPSPRPSPPQLRQVRTTFRARRHTQDATATTLTRGPGALLSWTIQGFQEGLSDTMLNWGKSWPFRMLPRLSKLYHLMPRPQCSKIWLLSGVKLRKSPKMHLPTSFFCPAATVSFGRWWKRWKLSHLKMTPPSDFIQWNR